MAYLLRSASNTSQLLPMAYGLFREEVSRRTPLGKSAHLLTARRFRSRLTPDACSFVISSSVPASRRSAPTSAANERLSLVKFVSMITVRRRRHDHHHSLEYIIGGQEPQLGGGRARPTRPEHLQDSILSDLTQSTNLVRKAKTMREVHPVERCLQSKRT